MRVGRERLREQLVDAGLLRHEHRRGLFELRDLGGHFLTPPRFPVAQCRAEDRVTSGLAFPGVGHREQINGNTRLTFTFEGKDAIPVDYQDYH